MSFAAAAALAAAAGVAAPARAGLVSDAARMCDLCSVLYQSKCRSLPFGSARFVMIGIAAGLADSTCSAADTSGRRCRWRPPSWR